jgi:alpha-glucosidase
VVNGSAKSVTIDQSLEGLYTPRYDGYHFNLIGLPFAPSKITVDGKSVKEFQINDDKTVEFKFSKNFKHIEISK